MRELISSWKKTFIQIQNILFTKRHKTSCIGRIESDIATKKCPYCKSASDETFHGSHQKKCMHRIIECLECSDIILLKNWYDHEYQNGEPKDSLLQHNLLNLLFGCKNTAIFQFSLC